MWQATAQTKVTYGPGTVVEMNTSLRHGKLLLCEQSGYSAAQKKHQKQNAEEIQAQTQTFDLKSVLSA